MRLCVLHCAVLGLLILSALLPTEALNQEGIDSWDITTEQHDKLHKLLALSELTGPAPKPKYVRYFDDSDPFYNEFPVIPTWHFNANTTCENDLLRILDQIQKDAAVVKKIDPKGIFFVLTQDWALRMIDADAKPPSGILDLNLVWLGNFDQCNQIHAPPDGNVSEAFDGKYCTLEVSIAKNNFSLPLKLGICVPSSCDEPELLRLLNHDPLQNRSAIQALSSLNVTAASIVCNIVNEPWTDLAIGILCLYSFFGLLIIAGTSLTLYEIFSEWLDESDEALVSSTINYTSFENEKDKDVPLLFSKDSKNSPLKKFLKCFCFITNASKLLSTDARADLQCVHGIRFFSMTWVILGHTYAFAGFFAVTGNPQHVIEIMDNLPFQAIINATYSVDSFFLLSGFLLTYLFLKEANKTEGKINWLMFYVHRYIRLTPVYALLLAFDYALSVHLGGGPFWHNESLDIGCKHAWWKNLLYINNFSFSTDPCFGWAWYLANDMQFYIISPLLLYPLWRWPKVGLSLISSLMLASWITSGVISAHFDLLPGYSSLTTQTDTLAYTKRIGDYMDKMYVMPYTRISPYLIGMILGYLISRHEQFKGRMSKMTVSIGWTVATVSALAMVYGFYTSNPSTNVAAAYNALSRSIFSAALAWLIYACLTGYGGPVNAILSWRGLIPLSRLTYCAYLVHPIIMNSYYLSIKMAWQITHGTMVILFFGFLVMSYAMAFAISLAFESSLMGLEKLVLKPQKKS